MALGISSLRLALKVSATGAVLSAEVAALPAEAVVGVLVVAVIGTIWLADRYLGKSGR
ncbi:hypothetical protein [Zoogloea sp.]|jgi:hypothetical protein|uniref:hypothetical protein n=1 Tax=Zoogloea sp. TaxID=49181 RepID=UPI00262BD57E|nr:hypothetical protein [Zoogloea sp.]